MAKLFLRNKVYWIDYQLNGKRIRESLGIKSKKLAQYERNKKEIEIEEGRAGISSTTKRVDEFFEEYCDHIKVRKALDTFKHEVSHLLPFSNICPILLKDVNAGTIQRFLTVLAQRRKGGKPRTVNSYLSHIKTFFKYAMECGYITSNPAQGIKKLNETKELPRFLSKEELKVYLPVAKKSPIWAMIATALYTGLRVNELMILRWKNIDFKKNIVTVMKSKSFKFRVVPLNNRLKAILKPLKKEGLCFTYKGKGYSGQPRKPLSHILEEIELKEEIKLKNVGWHTFRKTFASHLIMKGVSITKVSKWLGHASPVITYQTYAHLAPIKDQDIDTIEF